MDAELMLDVGQANELKLAFRRAGWTNAEVKRLCEGDTLISFLLVLRGCAEIVPRHFIDCDAPPSCPPDWCVESHQPGGRLPWDPTKVELYLSPNQKDGKVILGGQLRQELGGKRVANANLLDHLLAHQELIPEDWKGKTIFFWGTIYRNSDGYLYVRYLVWNGVRWLWSSHWIANDADEFSGRNPAAVLASR